MPTAPGPSEAVDRERKRARDRVYQRRKRERDRNLITKLRERVKTVEDRLDTPNSPASLNADPGIDRASVTPVDHNQQPLMSTNPRVDVDLSDLTALESDHCTICGRGGQQSSTYDLLSQMCIHMDSDFGRGVEDASHAAQSPSTARFNDRIDGYLVENNQDYVSVLAMGQVHTDVSSDGLSLNLAASLLPVRWTTLNDLFYAAAQPQGPSEGPWMAAEFDAHVIISGVLHGWDKVASIFKFNAVWECLRNVDELALCHSDIIARMAALKVIAMILRSQASRSDSIDLPPYLRPRPSQSAIEHPKLIDYFIWPGFRERMVFQYSKYANDGFAKRFSKCFKFVWPDAPHTAYTKTSSTPIYRFTDEFLECSEGIQCYRLERDFFEMFPEFNGDVPVVMSLPVSLQTPDYSWASELELLDGNEEASQSASSAFSPRVLLV